MATLECGHHDRDGLIREGPTLDVVLNNLRVTNSINKQLSALVDTGAELNMIEDTLAAGAVLSLKVVDVETVQTANGAANRPIYEARLTVPKLTYSKLHRFVGVNLGADRVILGREFLADFRLTYSGRSGKATLSY